MSDEDKKENVPWWYPNLSWWFCYDPLGDGLTYHETAEDAKERAEEALDYCRDASSDDSGWPEETDLICWGKIDGQVTLTASKPDPDGRWDTIDEHHLVAERTGDVKLMVGVDRERREVAIDFGRPVQSIQFTPALALAISNLITEAAFSVDASLTEMAMREDAWPKLSVLMDGKEVACEIKLPKGDGDE